MKAVFFRECGGPDKVEIGELEQVHQNLNQGEVRLKFLAGGLNHLDLWVLKGLPHLKYSFPHIAGADFCGEVVESKSQIFKVGEQVVLYPAQASTKPENLALDFGIRGETIPGVFCEEIVASDSYVFKKPAHLSIVEAAALPLVYLTAWQMAFEKAGIFEGWSEGPILLHGAGSGVTQALLELLLALNISPIYLTSRTPAKLEAWQKRGVKTFVWSSDLQSELKKDLSGKKFAVVFDHLGEKSFELNIKLLATGGRFITCGATTGFQAKLDLRHLFFRQLQLLGSTMGSLEHFKLMLNFVSSRGIRPAVSKVLPWDKAGAAYQELEAAKQNGKLVISQPLSTKA